MDDKLFTGVLGDPTTDPKVVGGWNVDEVLASNAPFEWKKKSKDELPKFPVWNQHRTSACVAFSKARQVSIKMFHLTGVWIDFSPASIYQLRENKPGEGMYIPNANEIVNTKGVTLEALMKSQNLTEAEIDAVRRTPVADLFAKAIAEAVVSYLYVPVDADRIAQTIEAKKPVSLLVYGTYDEYARERPVITNQTLQSPDAPIRHEIVAVGYYLNDVGEKCFYVNDSAHFGGLATREITEAFLTKRCLLADAIDVFTFDPGTGKPSYDGTTIVSAQKCLRYEGFFPANVDYVESLGPITKKAVNQFQIKYGLDPVGTGTIGPLTKKKLHELYP